ncbi:MAG: immunoglobulin-like domain-containing protein [Ruminococcus sp.]|jgi:hypothetical protein
MRRNIFRGVGLTGVILLAALFLFSIYQDNENSRKESAGEEVDAALFVATEELFYDGSGGLDLMEGVTARSSDGRDLTSQVNALLTGDGSGNRKQIRYTVFSPSGQAVTEKRTLVLENYQGPEITVSDHLELEAENLNDLIAVLKERGEIEGSDGYGRDITDQITWYREKISDGRYQLTFSLDNVFLDHAECQVQAHISGEVQDLTISLLENKIEIPAGSEFSPWDYLEAVNDPSFGSIADRVQIQSMVNTAVPGSYSVVYTAVSLDGTQRAQAVLQVTVTGGTQ